MKGRRAVVCANSSASLRREGKKLSQVEKGLPSRWCANLSLSGGKGDLLSTLRPEGGGRRFFLTGDNLSPRHLFRHFSFPPAENKVAGHVTRRLSYTKKGATTITCQEERIINWGAPY